MPLRFNLAARSILDGTKIMFLYESADSTSYPHEEIFPDGNIIQATAGYDYPVQNIYLHKNENDMEKNGTRNAAIASDGHAELARIIEFCTEIDKQKFIRRHTYLTDWVRLENDAEHAWHLAVMAILLSDYANEKIDLLKVVSMVLIHDLVEIYAGDTFAYDDEGKLTQKARESAAADKLFSMLPDKMEMKMRGLWDEFEAWESPEAKFAHTMDNFQPMMLQAATDGKSWQEDGRTLAEVLGRNSRTAEGSEILWEYAKSEFISKQIAKGHLKE